MTYDASCASIIRALYYPDPRDIDVNAINQVMLRRSALYQSAIFPKLL